MHCSKKSLFAHLVGAKRLQQIVTWPRLLPVYRGQILVNWRPPTLEAAQAFALAGANAVARRPGNHMPTIAALSDNIAAMPIAGQSRQ